MRKQFVMTQEQLNAILDACKPVPYMVVGGMPPRSPQENANAAWARLGQEMGFEPMSVRPVAVAGMEVFTAEEVARVSNDD
jgi:predicted TIM-barrel fold metal-dependent hydrolase